MSRRMKKVFAKKMEEFEVTKKARVQIERYKRQYKIMEGSRLAYNEELSIQLDKQKSHLKQLELEKCNLNTERNYLSSVSTKHRKLKLQDRINELLKEKNYLEEEVKQSRNWLLDISSQIMTIESELDHQKLKRIDRHSKMEALKSRESNISYYESQLSMETVELNKLMTKNRRVREEMEVLLQERTRFRDLLDRLVARLHGGRLLIQDLMEQGTAAFEHREEAQSKLLILRRKMSGLREKHGQAMRDLGRELEDNVRSAAFLTTKAQERGGKAARVEEEEAKKLEVHEEVDRLERIYRKVTIYFPGIQDSRTMAEQYLVQEDENFAIFNYVNEVNSEVESIQMAGEELKKSLAEEEERKVEELRERRSELSTLTERLEDVRRLSGCLVSERDSTVVEKQLLVSSCLQLYNQLISEPSPFEALIDKNEISSNPEYCLKRLEKKIRETLEKMREELPPEPRFSMKSVKSAFNHES